MKEIIEKKRQEYVKERQKYVNLFNSIAEAIEFEGYVLSAAIEPTPEKYTKEYYEFLIEQKEQVDLEQV